MIVFKNWDVRQKILGVQEGKALWN